VSDQPALWEAGRYLPPAGVGRPYGIDVSDHNGDVNWPATRQGGCTFAFIKASEGTGYTPTTFIANWRGSKAAGVIRSPYHYFHPELPGKDQADYFLQQIASAGGLDLADVHPALDVEDSFGQGAATVEAQLYAFAAEIEARTGRPTIVYTYPYYMRQFLPHISNLVTTSPLWFASYGSAPEHYLGQVPWSFWQYSDQGHVPGVPVAVDLDVFNGTLAQLNRLTGTNPLAPIPIPPPPPDARIFPQTGYYISHGFRDKWEEYEALGKAMEVIGYPITGEHKETIGNWTGTVQYFERARMEWHEDLSPPAALFGRLGAEVEDLP
jgi:lysozyme